MVVPVPTRSTVKGIAAAPLLVIMASAPR
ncbi:CRISPR-associated protein Cas5 [Microbulbifer elongatus]|uniref:CRISPR-associated protein Cas5 n=1 Tax=Microbulbifer elongatus TaxID=86173 RepID=A0ABT1P4L6_9GAMM|nr:CRISPR-associated protein Cas5 [Microbulbifer elongatus]